MISTIKNMVLGGSTEATAEVSLTRATRLKPVGTREPIDAEAGSVHTVTLRQAKELEAAGAGEIVGTREAAEATAQNLAALLPPPEEPAPPPDAWADLPKCFAQWHELSEDGACLARRAAAIERSLLARMRACAADLGDTTKLPAFHRRAIVERAAAGIMTQFSEREAREQRYLRDAHQRAAETLDNWRGLNAAKLFALEVECSDSLMRESGALAKTCRELHEIGRAIFAERIGPLGLSAQKEEGLYLGGADYQKYEAAAPIPKIPDLKMLWFHDDGADQRSFCGSGVPAIAGHLQSVRARQAELEPLAKQGRADLKRTKAAAAA